MKNRITTIYLADLANDGYGVSPATVPLGIGYLKAYAEKEFPGQLQVELFRTFGSLHDRMQEREPDILGLSWYGWNRFLTTNALTYLKKKCPTVITVVGGANAPREREGALRDFIAYPAIDIIVPNEGEAPFVNLLNAYRQRGPERLFDGAIDGLFFRDAHRTGIVAGVKLSRPVDLDLFPSPYLDGSLDSFLEQDLMPVLQGSRGCPFGCVFCVSAHPDWNKVRAFSLDRVKEEIRYVQKKAKNRVLRFADENFGVIENDREISRFLARTWQTERYPSGLRVYTHKVVNNRVKEIILNLRQLLPMNISFQTLTPEVLANIDRKNVGLDKVAEYVDWAHQHGINASTELIFGLPGESVDTFLDVITQLVNVRIDSIVVGALWMLKETSLEDPAFVEKHGYKVKYSVAERGYTTHGDFSSAEIDIFAVESASYGYDDFIWMRNFALLFELFMFRGYFKEVTYMWEARGVTAAAVIRELLDHRHRYPVIGKNVIRYEKELAGSLFDTEQEAITAFYHHQANRADDDDEFVSSFTLACVVSGEFISPANQSLFIDEVFSAAARLYEQGDRKDALLFEEEMAFARTLVPAIITPFWEEPTDRISVESPYDLVAWANDSFAGALSDYRLDTPVRYTYSLKSLNLYKEFLERNEDKPYYLQSENFFRTFYTSYCRRYIAVAENECATA